MSASHPEIAVEAVEFRVHPTRTRFPFRYGIAAMTAAPHVFAQATLCIDGKAARGIAAEGLPPKWFTKDPLTSFEEDLQRMLKVLR
ncbi:MAG: hypothetical protein ACC661_02195, partial [Verrucomicrobiales bacterium]